MEILSCPYSGCNNKFPDNSVKFELKKYGRVCLCPKCGKAIMVTKPAMLSKPMPRMSKKERKKARLISKEAIALMPK